MIDVCIYVILVAIRIQRAIIRPVNPLHSDVRLHYYAESITKLMWLPILHPKVKGRGSWSESMALPRIL